MEVYYKNVIFDVILTIIYVELTFLFSKSSGPQTAVQGLAEYWLFQSYSHSFGYSFEAVRGLGLTTLS
jgi:hypothetical protein